MIECRPWSNEHWEDIEVYPYSPTFNVYHRPQFFKCHWCGGDAIVVVSRKSRLTDATYEDYACEYHARGWLPPAPTAPERRPGVSARGEDRDGATAS